MKGILLAGGSGTRLYPLTRVISKQLLPVFDKPMVYYPLSTLMLAGIRDVLLISTPEDTARFSALLGDGSQWGLNIEYAVQQTPNGPSQAFVIGAHFTGTSSVALILGDNVFYGNGLSGLLQRAAARIDGATIFGFHVPDAQRYGVVEIGRDGRVRSIEEKPVVPRSSYAITGLQFFDNQVTDIARSLSPSPRGEYELADVHQFYLRNGTLRVDLLGRGMAWFDAGTHESLQEASSFIQTVEKRQGLKVACVEEIAFRMGYIDDSQLHRLCEAMPATGYATYLRALLADAVGGGALQSWKEDGR